MEAGDDEETTQDGANCDCTGIDGHVGCFFVYFDGARARIGAVEGIAFVAVLLVLFITCVHTIHTCYHLFLFYYTMLEFLLLSFNAHFSVTAFLLTVVILPLYYC